MKWFVLSFFVFFSSCSGISEKNNPTFSERYPASRFTHNSCQGTMSYLLSKRRRSQTMNELVAKRDVEGIKELFWRGHMNEREEVKRPYSRFYRRLRRWNQSHHVPALFQTKNKFVGEEDTFSTIFKVVDDEIGQDAEEAQALEDILGWVEYVTKYKERFNKQIEVGVEQKLMLESLQKEIRGLKRSDFPKDLDVPVYADGSVNMSGIRFDSLDDLKDLINEKKRMTALSFTQNMMDEYFKKSRLYQVMIDQALYVRRLQLVMERLSNIPDAKLSADQKTLKEMIEDVLSDPFNQPRKDAMKVVRNKEFRKELFASLRFWRSRRVENQAKYTISSSVLQKARELSPYGMFMRSAAILTLTTGAIITPITIIYDDNPWVMYVTSLISNYFNDFIVNGLGLPSSSLSECYKSERPWSVEEASSMNSFIESHLSRYTAMQRLDPSYDPNNDPDYVAQKLELQAMCSNLRLKYKAADRHVENKELLNEHGYRFAAHMVLIELVEQEKGEGIGALLYDYFEADEVFDDEEKAKVLYGKIVAEMGQDFGQKLRDYQENINGMVPRIRNGDFEIYYPSTDEYFESLK